MISCAPSLYPFPSGGRGGGGGRPLQREENNTRVSGQTDFGQRPNSYRKYGYWKCTFSTKKVGFSGRKVSDEKVAFQRTQHLLEFWFGLVCGLNVIQIPKEVINYFLGQHTCVANSWQLLYSTIFSVCKLWQAFLQTSILSDGVFAEKMPFQLKSSFLAHSSHLGYSWTLVLWNANWSTFS